MTRPTRMERLTRMIESAGFSDVCLYPAKGAWRTDKRLDVNPWEGSARSAGFLNQPHGIRVSFAGWSTMTECVRRGIEIEPDGAWWQLRVCAKGPDPVKEPQ